MFYSRLAGFAGEILNLTEAPEKLLYSIRRFWFAGLVFVFLLADITSPVAAQSQQPETVTVSQAVQEAVENNLNLLAERYNLNIADARIGAARLRTNPVMSIGGDRLDLIGAGFNDINGAGPPEYSIRTDFSSSAATKGVTGSKPRDRRRRSRGCNC